MLLLARLTKVTVVTFREAQSGFVKLAVCHKSDFADTEDVSEMFPCEWGLVIWKRMVLERIYVLGWFTKIIVVMLRACWASISWPFDCFFQSFISGFLKKQIIHAPKCIFFYVFFSLVATYMINLFLVVILYFWGGLFCGPDVMHSVFF